MPYIGSAPASQAATFAGVYSQSFNGNGSTTTFTLGRYVAQAANIEVIVNNVQQSPFDGSYSLIGGTSLVFSEAPSAGTNNIYVIYRDYPVQTLTDTGAVRKTGDTMSGGLVIDTVTNGTPSISLRHSNTDADNFIIQCGTPGVTNGGFTIRDIDAAANRFIIDAAGRVTMPFQPYARGSCNSLVTAPAVIPINSFISSRGGISTSSDRFTVPVTGAYAVGYHHLGNSGSGACQIVITRNGSVISGTRTQDTNSSNDSFSTQTVVELAANDFIQFYTNQGVVHGNPDYNSMWIYLIG